MLRDALLVAGKDLRIEARSRVGVNQVAPFALLVLVLFAFALEPDRGILARAAAGLFWLAVTFSALLAVQRSFALETADGGRDGLRLSGLDPAGIFVGKAAAITVQLLALEVLLAAGVALLYDADLDGWFVLAATAVLASVGLSAAGCVYGVLSAGTRANETLLPLLLVPVAAPVVLCATKAWEAAMGGSAGDAGSWMRLLAAFAVAYAAIGTLSFGVLLEEA
ncbi:MAG TPA: heme exporter protein CcmB [Acidimicrobiales bacterium]|nr:heme exporter protein CcmB [Acidimicrobiales bacterium]